MKENTVIEDFPISINEKAVMRHLGYPAARAAESPHVKRSLETVRGFIRHYSDMMKPHAVYRFFLSLSGDGVLTLPEEGIELRSPFLAGRFRDSETVGLFVATIGSEIEEQVKRFLNEGKHYEAMVLDAIGSEAAEAAAWSIHRRIQILCKKRLVRYSPGYNEGVTDRAWPIHDQALIFRLLSPGQIGVSLSPACMMIPRKSVSAIIGSASAP
ncbi:MAG: vitamin B12 dependent-methionine synthase activation domain-containing protein [Vulcanimicrobiota bacterium]